MLVKLTTGVNFINILRTAFALVAPRGVRIQSNCQCLFTLLESTSVKAVCRMLMKLSPAVNFINVFCTNFLYECLLWSFSLVTCLVAFCFGKKFVRKCARIMLMKLTPGRHQYLSTLSYYQKGEMNIVVR
jgi:hypothetical protein